MLIRLLYNTGLCIADKIAKVICGKQHGLAKRIFNEKTLDFIDGRFDLQTFQSTYTVEEGKTVYWFHASSLGEYAVARPIMKAIKERNDCTIVLTFFSATGCNALRNKSVEYRIADHILYLPLDTKGNAREFLDAVKPQKACFIISEYWINFLEELKARGIQTYLVSAIIREDSIFTRWYGRMYRQALNCFTHISVLNKESKALLAKLGYDNATVTGDMLFDNAIGIANTAYCNDIIADFCKSANGDVFIAGSISDEKDLQLVASLANKKRHQKFIFVPHEINDESLSNIKNSLVGNVLLYSECDRTMHNAESSGTFDFCDVQVLVIDFIGALSRIYRYCRYAYVGGGFTPYLHSVIEPVVYGLPVSFGPRIERKVTPKQLEQLGIGKMVETNSDIERWYDAIAGNDARLSEIKTTALRYIEEQGGVVASIMKIIGES